MFPLRCFINFSLTKNVVNKMILNHLETKRQLHNSLSLSFSKKFSPDTSPIKVISKKKRKISSSSSEDDEKASKIIKKLEVTPVSKKL